MADPVVEPVGKADASDQFVRAGARLAPADSVQGALVEHVLLDREVGIERAALEHDAELGERRAAVARNVMAEDADRARPAGVEMGDDREQRALACAVEAEQHGEGRGLDREAYVIERLARAIGVRDAFDRKRRRKARRDGEGRALVHWRVIATPQG